MVEVTRLPEGGFSASFRDGLALLEKGEITREMQKVVREMIAGDLNIRAAIIKEIDAAIKQFGQEIVFAGLRAFVQDKVK